VVLGIELVPAEQQVDEQVDEPSLGVCQVVVLVQL
jgi:hypothetical protein